MPVDGLGIGGVAAKNRRRAAEHLHHYDGRCRLGRPVHWIGAATGPAAAVRSRSMRNAFGMASTEDGAEDRQELQTKAMNRWSMFRWPVGPAARLPRRPARRIVPNTGDGAVGHHQK
jgi:hypothetical protein